MPRIALVFLLVLIGGCVATPLPDPPSLDPPELDTLAVTHMSTGLSFTIEGMPGTVAPDVTVVAANLDTTDPPVRAAATADGGFSMVVLGFPSDIVRVHLEREDDGARSPPVDFVASTGTPVPFIAPLSDCLEVPVELATGRVEVGSRRSVSIPIRNECSADVRVDAIALRVPVSGLSVSSAPPLDIAPMGEGAVDIEVAPTSAGDFDAVLILGITAPEASRRAVTVRGVAD